MSTATSPPRSSPTRHDSPKAANAHSAPDSPSSFVSGLRSERLSPPRPALAGPGRPRDAERRTRNPACAPTRPEISSGREGGHGRAGSGTVAGTGRRAPRAPSPIQCALPRVRRAAFAQGGASVVDDIAATRETSPAGLRRGGRAGLAPAASAGDCRRARPPGRAAPPRTWRRALLVRGSDEQDTARGSSGAGAPQDRSPLAPAEQGVGARRDSRAARPAVRTRGARIRRERAPRRVLQFTSRLALRRASPSGGRMRGAKLDSDYSRAVVRFLPIFRSCRLFASLSFYRHSFTHSPYDQSHIIM
jgi:hypothetical protein